MFPEIEARPDFPSFEEETLRFWREHTIFAKSMAKNEGNERFVFFEGPPTANGKPGIHHILARSFKDLYPRFQTMNGKYCLRKAGWDTHGLPVELEVEKQLGFSGKKDIEEYGIAKFNEKCRESVFTYLEEWQKLTERMGFWLDMDDPYVTMDNEYIASCWWILKQLFEKELLYEDYKVVPYCPRCGTPLSSHEVAQGYEDVEDPSVYVSFRLTKESTERLHTFVDHDFDTAKPVSFLAWTTTPWTLPGNVALAINESFTYTLFRDDATNEYLVLAADALTRAEHALPTEGHDVTPVGEVSGRDLVGLSYEPLFDAAPQNEASHQIVAADFVTLDDGTGIVHTAVMYGAEDFELGTQVGLPKEHVVNEDGTFKESVTEFAGMFVKDADPLVVKNLEERGLLYAVLPYTHSYPHCWRCSSPLLYYASDTWYVRTTAHKQELIDANQQVNWVPAHLKNGRMGSWLDGMLDWALSRNRYWATPLPLWRCDDCSHVTCVGGVEDLRDRLAEGSTVPDDLHRPYIDEVKLSCDQCEGTMTRIDHVIDVWFDSGAMPAAQWGYPHAEGSADQFAQYMPADFIAEAMDQTRGWFYTLLAANKLTFDQHPYKNVITLGLVLDEKGKKMSKSVGNVVDPWEVMETVGVDATRWYFYTVTTPGNEYRFSVDQVRDVVRRFFLTLWNTQKFFIAAASRDGWEPQSVDTASRTALDRWMRSRLHSTVQQVTAALEHYDAFTAGRTIEALIQDFSVWYIRRSRDRVAPDADGTDAASFYATAYETLLTTSTLMAPMAPFLAERVYQNLTAARDDLPESVHLAAWPAVDSDAIDETLEEHMSLVRDIVEKGHAARKDAGIKVRQPLASVTITQAGPRGFDTDGELHQLIMAELNVKAVSFDTGGSDDPVVLDTELTEALREEGAARDLIRDIQVLRKKTGLTPTDHIQVYAPSWPAAFEEQILATTRATSLHEGDELRIELTPPTESNGKTDVSQGDAQPGSAKGDLSSEASTKEE